MCPECEQFRFDKERAEAKYAVLVENYLDMWKRWQSNVADPALLAVIDAALAFVSTPDEETQAALEQACAAVSAAEIVT